MEDTTPPNPPADGAGRHVRTRQASLLNRPQCRKFILDTMQRTMPHLRITRVSQEALDKLEFWLREKMRQQVHSHPSVGKTFRP